MDEPRDAITVAVETLARELSCTPAELSVTDVRPITWPDSSLGCPRPGTMYMQMLTPGYQIRFARAGQQYIVHTDRGHHAVYCPGGGILPDADGVA